MMAESSDYIVILSEGHKSMFPQATCHPFTHKIYVAKNGINICLSGQICYLMCTGPFIGGDHVTLIPGHVMLIASTPLHTNGFLTNAMSPECF